jgi:hypothetical protein
LRLENVISHLAYSVDGRYLAASLGGENGVRIYASSDYREIYADKDYQDSYCRLSLPPAGYDQGVLAHRFSTGIKAVSQCPVVHVTLV